MFRRLLARFSLARARQQIESDMAFVPLRDAQGRVTGAIDRLTAAYLRSPAPNPSQPTLDAMFDQVTRVRVLDGGTIDGKAMGSTVLLECSDIPSIAVLHTCLAIVEDPRTFGHCMCLGDNAIECYSDHELMATIGLHHGYSIRWDVWKHDAQLRDGQVLLNWLADRGVIGPLEAHQAQQQQAEEARQATQRWYNAMPLCLHPYWPQMQGFEVDLEPLRQALLTAYPDRAACVCALFGWFGSGQGPWSGFPMYEQVVEQLLLDFPTDALVEALTQHPITPAQFEGAARYFAGWGFRKHKPSDLQLVPAELKQRLLMHSLTLSNSDNVQRAQKAFA